jgi:mono/diheme cytochrome c family protein/glucose/arabinose dehydrogenase
LKRAAILLVLLSLLGFEAARTWFKADPKPPPARSVRREMRSFQLADPALEVTPAATEPLVSAPVAAVFDEDGRLWVVEMSTYMPDAAGTGELEPKNRITVLEDTDADGTFDRSTPFMENMVLPRSVAPCYQQNGRAALVLAPPKLLFCRDTNADGIADDIKELLAGFGGIESPEHAGNGLVRGIDNWYHFSQHDTEVRFDGEKLETRKTPNHGQWGLAMDDQGRFYYTPNSNALLTDAYPKHYALRNPRAPGAPGMGELIAPDSTTWPIHPTPGVNRGYMPNVLRPDKTLASLTGACGPVIVRSSRLGNDFQGDAFICEVAGNLVKRIEMSTRGFMPHSENTYKGREFLASDDERFRPVNLCEGPDGCLYLVDMYRGVVQHRIFVTPYLREQIAARHLETPLNLGRIWRIGPRAGERPAAPKLSKSTDAELVKLLAHPDGWWRDTAQRLLIERRAAQAETSLRAMVREPGASTDHAPSQASCDPALTSLHALWTLEGLGLATREDCLAAMKSPSPLVRAAGLRVAETWLTDAEDNETLLAAALKDPDASVRLQAILTTGATLGAPTASALLAPAVQNPTKYERGAIVQSLKGAEKDAIDRILKAEPRRDRDGDKALLKDLAACLLKGSAFERTALTEIVLPLVAAGDTRAEPILKSIEDAARIDTDEPRRLMLVREPAAFRQVALAEGPLGDRLRNLSPAIEWPGKPAEPFKGGKVRAAGQKAQGPRSPDKPLTAPELVRFTKGATLFAMCATCHQATGEGTRGQAPSLIGTKRVLGPEDPLVRIVLHGTEGAYAIGDEVYQGVMPPPPLQDDEEVAAVLTYIRRSWGNTAPAVSPETVGKVRKKYAERKSPWTLKELEAE